MLPEWTLPSNTILDTLIENQTISIALPLANPSETTTSVISGSLPTGLRLENNNIVGTPVQVARTTTKTFVIRASTSEGILDRTFKFIVEGADEPEWITQEGALPVGPNNVYFILDSTPIDFQLLANDPDLPAGDSLEYFIKDGDGVLPPGITLTSDGKLVGTVEPLLALDVNKREVGYDTAEYSETPFDYSIKSTSGLDSFLYDLEVYDYAERSRPPKKLNRTYEFFVTVADNVSSVKRKFSIYVVGDDYVRADNTILAAANGVFTADATYLRSPIWTTPSDLGKRRANNYQTVYLDTIDPNTVAGTIRYVLNAANPDGTDSELPPGLTLDSKTGELAGIVPYMPAVSKKYDFTVAAIRFDSDEGIVTVFGTFYEDTMSGNKTIKLAKLPVGTEDGIEDLTSLVGQTVEISNKPYSIESVDDSNEEYDTITLVTILAPISTYDVLTVNKSAAIGQNFFYVNTLSDSSQSFYRKKELTLASGTKRVIEDVYPFIEFTITPEDSSVFLELNESVTGTDNGPVEEEILKSFLTYNGREPEVTILRDGLSNILEVNLKIPSTADTRNQNYIASMFHTTDSSDVQVTLNGQYDRILLDNNLTASLNENRQLSFGVIKGDSFSKTLPRAEIDTVESLRTFTIEVIGEIESEITWITPSDLGIIKSNRPSNLRVTASTSLSGFISYSISAGKLPPGLTLKKDGEITGKIANNGTVSNPGLTLIDGDTTTFDGEKLSFDRSYKFTVVAKDRANYTATTREFTLQIDDSDSKLYSSIFMKPFLKKTQRDYFQNFVNDSRIFTPSAVYRPSDENFGVQKELKSLVFSGLEQRTMSNLTAAIRKNHKRKNFNFGSIKTAEAKLPGTNETVYEVVYVELIDPAMPSKGKARTSFKTLSNNKITVDSEKLEGTNSDILQGTDSGVGIAITQRNSENAFILRTVDDQIKVRTRDGIVYEVGTADGIPVVTTEFLRIFITVTAIVGSTIDDVRRFRPINDTITIDSDAIKISQTSDVLKYISNIEHMRDRLDEAGDKSKDFRPLWMRTAQQNDLKELGYVFAVPLVFTKPGFAKTIAENIQQSNFEFKTIDYDIDRYIVDSVQGLIGEQYVFFADYAYNV